jgi:DNA polymerase
MLEATECPDVTRMLELRQEMSKTSVKKYAAMANALGSDNRIRGLLQYYGANRTGRWAGRLVQIQNLPQNHLEDLDLARSLVKQGDADLLEMCYGNVPAVLSELIRTAFIAGEGKTFVVADFSAIEARVIAWLADEMWVLDVFKTHGKIYEATAANMFHVPLEEVTKGSPLRQKGKVATLALGYQGGVNALTAMDSGKSIPEEEKPGLVERWRAANPHIVRLWKEVERAALKAVREATTVKIRHGVTFIGGGGMLYVELPSGRRLSYARPRLTTNQWGSDSLTYEGMDQVKKTWGRVPTYGGKLTENIVQAIARDCLAESLMQVDAAGYEIVMHVHDELVVEVPIGEQEETLEEICRIMGRELSWAKGLPLRADGYITPYYKKE